MAKVRNNSANHGEADARHENRRSENSSNGRRENYRYTASARHVARTVACGDKKVTTKLPIENSEYLNGDPQSAFDKAFLGSSTRPVRNKDLPAVRGGDIFCGSGGLSLGASEACSAIGFRFEPLLAIDKDTTSLEVYIDNFDPRQAYNRDIWELLCGEIGSRLEPCEKNLLKGLKDLDIALAGPPCQGNSNLNNHTRRKDYRNKLYERVGRFAEIAEPKHILIENVPTVVYGRDRALDNTVDLLDKLGYELDTGIVDLSELGVAQRRRRHVLVASVEKSISIQDTVEKYRVSKERDVRWAIGDLEKEDSGLFDGPAEVSRENLDRIRYLMKYDIHDLPNNLRPPCHQDGDHSYRSMYGRLKYDEPAQTITTGFGSPGQGRYIHPVRPRTLTPHEAARLQFFPDFFDFSSARFRTSLATMIGNAVPMKLSYVFCLELLT